MATPLPGNRNGRNMASPLPENRNGRSLAPGSGYMPYGPVPDLGGMPPKATPVPKMDRPSYDPRQRPPGFPPYPQGPMGGGVAVADREAYDERRGREREFGGLSLENLRGSTRAITGDEIKERMNPYTDLVIDRYRQDALKENQIQQARRTAGRAGYAAFGSRGALADARAVDDEQERLETSMANLRNQGFQSAQELVGSERNRMAQVGSTAGSLATAFGGMAQADITQGDNLQTNALNRYLNQQTTGSNLQTAAQDRYLNQGRFDLTSRQTASGLDDAALERDIRRMGVLSKIGGIQQADMQGRIDDSRSLYGELFNYPNTVANQGAGILQGLPAGSTTTAPTGYSPVSSAMGTALAIGGMGVGDNKTLLGSALGMYKRGGRVKGYKPYAVGGMVMEDIFPFATDEELMRLASSGTPDIAQAAAMEIERRRGGGGRVGLTQSEMTAWGESPDAYAGLPMPTMAGGSGADTFAPRPAPTPAPAPATLAPRPEPAQVASAPAQASFAGAPPQAEVTRLLEEPYAPQSAGALSQATMPAQAEEPSIWERLAKEWGTVDPLTGTSKMYDLGVNLLAANANPSPGRGFAGNLGLALKATEEGRRKLGTEAAERALAVAKLRIEQRKADAAARAPNTELAKLREDYTNAMATGDVELADQLMTQINRVAAGTREATGRSAVIGDQRFGVLRDAEGDYIMRDGQKQYLGDLTENFSVETRQPSEGVGAKTEAAAAADYRASQQQLSAIDNIRRRISALKDEDLGTVGSIRRGVSDVIGVTEDVASAFGLDIGRLTAGAKARIGDATELRTIDILEEALYEMVVQQRAEARNRAPTVEEQRRIRDIVSLASAGSSAAGVRAKAGEILSNLERGTFAQGELAQITGGADPTAVTSTAPAPASMRIILDPNGNVVQ